MKKINFWFPIEMLDRLKLAKVKTGIPVIEFIRRAVDKSLAEIGFPRNESN